MLAAALRWLEADPAGRLPLLERLLSTARLPPALAKQKVLMRAAGGNAVVGLYCLDPMLRRSACDQDMLPGLKIVNEIITYDHSAWLPSLPGSNSVSSSDPEFTKSIVPASTSSLLSGDVAMIQVATRITSSRSSVSGRIMSYQITAPNQCLMSTEPCVILFFSVGRSSVCI